MKQGKSGAEIKDELRNANTSIALVSTLTWAIAWDLLFGWLDAPVWHAMARDK